MHLRRTGAVWTRVRSLWERSAPLAHGTKQHVICERDDASVHKLEPVTVERAQTHVSYANCEDEHDPASHAV